MENKNIFLGMDLAGDELAVLCLNVDNETFYFEFNDCDLTKADTNLLNRMMFINNGEKTICYKSGEKGITFIRDTKEMIKENIENIIRQYCKDCNISFVGNIKPLEFVKFFELLDGVKSLTNISIDDYYLSLDAIEIALNIIRISDDTIFGIKRSENDNRIVSTLLVKNLYENMKKIANK